MARASTVPARVRAITALLAGLALGPTWVHAQDQTIDEADFLDFLEYLGSWEDGEEEREWQELVDDTREDSPHDPDELRRDEEPREPEEFEDVT